MAKARTRRTQAERSAETRKALLDASIAALYEHGYSATTTMLVAERARVSRGGMLHQFPTKADLMAYVVESVYADEVQCYAELLKDVVDPDERVLAYPEAVWKVLSRPSGLAVLEILQGSRADKVLARKLRPIQARIEADALARLKEEMGRPQSLHIMRLIVWAVRGLSIAKVLAGDNDPVEECVVLLRELLKAGMSTGLLTTVGSPGRVRAGRAPSKTLRRT
jgi:AcrR family transcriptional regulator